MTLRSTPNRIALARAIDRGDVQFDPETSEYVMYAGRSVTGVVTHRFNELRSAGLAKQIRFTHTELTDDGRLWLDRNGGTR